MAYMLLEMMTRPIIGKTNEKMVIANDLPINVKLFVQKHFSRQAISFAEMRGAEYEIYLNDGTEVNFTKNGTLKMVDCKLEAVPSSLLPEAIVANVKALFDDAFIVKIDNNAKGYEVTLSNAINLKYSMGGYFA